MRLDIAAGVDVKITFKLIMLGIVGTKKGMTRVFKDDGRSIPVTVVEVFNSKIVQRKLKNQMGISQYK